MLTVLDENQATVPHLMKRLRFNKLSRHTTPAIAASNGDRTLVRILWVKTKTDTHIAIRVTFQTSKINTNKIKDSALTETLVSAWTTDG